MISTLYQLFPSTIHPMVVHFTIAFIYLTALVGLLGLVIPSQRAFFAKAFLWMLLLSIFATLAAGVAGAISESYARITPQVAHALEQHKNDGELTGVLVVIAFAVQWLFGRKRSRVSVVAVLFCIAATVMVSIAGHLGGMMVYDHGLGVVVHTSTQGMN